MKCRAHVTHFFADFICFSQFSEDEKNITIPLKKFLINLYFTDKFYTILSIIIINIIFPMSNSQSFYYIDIFLFYLHKR